MDDRGSRSFRKKDGQHCCCAGSNIAESPSQRPADEPHSAKGNIDVPEYHHADVGGGREARLERVPGIIVVALCTRQYLHLLEETKIDVRTTTFRDDSIVKANCKSRLGGLWKDSKLIMCGGMERLVSDAYLGKTVMSCCTGQCLRIPNGIEQSEGDDIQKELYFQSRRSNNRLGLANVQKLKVIICGGVGGEEERKSRTYTKTMDI